MSLTLERCVQGHAEPVQLMAVKSRLGHAETGAGALGVFHACQALCGRSTDALVHLRTLNPHVAGVLDSHSRKLQAALPRQAGPAQASCVGISSFAFQVQACLPCTGLADLLTGCFSMW